MMTVYTFFQFTKLTSRDLLSVKNYSTACTWRAMIFNQPVYIEIHGGMRGKPRTPYRCRIRPRDCGRGERLVHSRTYIWNWRNWRAWHLGGSVNIMHIAVRATGGGGGAGRRKERVKDCRCVGKGNAHPDGYRPPFLVSTTPGTRSSPSALKRANNRSALAFHLGMPLFRSANSIRALFLLFPLLF